MENAIGLFNNKQICLKLTCGCLKGQYRHGGRTGLSTGHGIGVL